MHVTKAAGCSLLWKETAQSPWPHEPREPWEPVAAEDPAEEPEAWTHPGPFFALASSPGHAPAAFPPFASRHAAWLAQDRRYIRKTLGN